MTGVYGPRLAHCLKGTAAHVPLANKTFTENKGGKNVIPYKATLRIMELWSNKDKWLQGQNHIIGFVQKKLAKKKHPRQPKKKISRRSKANSSRKAEVKVPIKKTPLKKASGKRRN